MRDTVNKEGLTFEEWVCAAGVAVIDTFVKPYSESHTTYVPAPRPKHLEGTVLLVFGTSRPPAGIPKRHRTTWYPKKVRDAWRAGEDPSEWRQ